MAADGVGKGGKLIVQEFAPGSGLTVPQLAFAVRVASGEKPRDAAQALGLAGHDTMMRNPAVIAAIHAEREKIIRGKVGTLAVSRLHQWLENEEAMAAPSTVGFKVVELALALAGHGTRIGQHVPKPLDKPLHEMSADELRTLLAAESEQDQALNVTVSEE